MADGFIVRRSGKAKQTTTPSILDFSTVSATSIKFKLRNNDEATATLVYRFGTLTGDGDSISLATNTTSNEITLTGLTLPGSLFVTANAVGKVKSEVAEEEFEVPIIYTAATGGTTEEYNLDGKRYRSHTFLDDGDFVVTTAGNGDRNQVDYLVIAGGGGTDGNTKNYPGGGGAGGYRTSLGTQGGLGTLDSKITVTATTYGIVVGAGGVGATGSNSTFDTITSLGGGHSIGGGTTGFAGGSGGASGLPSSITTINGGAGTANQGFAGGNTTRESNRLGTAGGGGAGEAGNNNGATNAAGGGNGGDGLSSIIRTGSAEFRAGGGGGLSWFNILVEPQGGLGGGGNGGYDLGNATSVGQNGAVNTGGGAGANSSAVNTGGSGIVIIRYEIAPSV